MLKHIIGITTPVVIGAAGGEINGAKKEAQFLATILHIPVRLIFNDNSYLIDADGNCIREQGDVEKILNTINKE